MKAFLAIGFALVAAAAVADPVSPTANPGGLHAQLLSVLALNPTGVLPIANYVRASDAADVYPPIALSPRLVPLAPPPGIPFPEDRKPGGWLARTQGFNAWGTIEADGQNYGTRYTLGGGTLLIDRLGARADRITGVFLGSGGGRLEMPTIGARTLIDEFRLGGYAYRRWDSLYGLAIGQYASFDFESCRPLVTGSAIGHFAADGLSFYGEVGTGRAEDAYDLEPFVSLQVNHQAQDGFTETGTTAESLTAQPGRGDAVLLGAGLRIRGHWGAFAGKYFSPELRLRYLHDFVDPQQSIRVSTLGSPATVSSAVSADPGRDVASVGAGLAGRLTPGATYIVNYDAQFSARQTVQVADMSISWKF